MRVLRNRVLKSDEGCRQGHLTMSSSLIKVLSLLTYVLLEIYHRALWKIRRSIRWRNYIIEIEYGVFSPVGTISTSLLAKVIDYVLSRVERIKLGLDVGTGTGALALVLSRYCQYVVATDISRVACRVAKRNLRRYGVLGDVVLCDVASALRTKSIDVAVTNPPYLPISRKLKHGDLYSGDMYIKFVLEALRVARRLVLTSLSTYLKRVSIETTKTLKSLKAKTIATVAVSPLERVEVMYISPGVRSKCANR